MRMAVLGAGNGGVASAFDFAQHGHDVALYAAPEFGENVVAISRGGRDQDRAASSRASSGAVRRVTTSPRRWPAPNSWLLVGPAYSTEPLAAAAGLHLSEAAWPC